MKDLNKWKNGAIPALLLHCSIGTVYCWSIFSQEIANYIGFSKSLVEWAFSLAIFFLGMSAAFMGNIVEKNIHKSSLISTITFTLGMVGTGFFIWFGGKHQGNLVSLIGIYICYGVIMGIGLGTGYLSPVKTLMIWFNDKKGLATGLAVAGFGAAKAIASPIMQILLDKTNLYLMFFILSGVYFVMMFIGHLLLKKPLDWVESQNKFSLKEVYENISQKPLINYIAIWLIFYINISCGLSIISQEKFIVKEIGLGEYIGLIAMASAIFNAAGRIGFSSIADKLKNRNYIYITIFVLSITVVGLGLMSSYDLHASFFMLIMILIINAGYGGGFSNMPALLADKYGMKKASTIHGITLSAWAFAGLTGNQIATFLLNKYDIKAVLIMVLSSYFLALVISTCFIDYEEK